MPIAQSASAARPHRDAVKPRRRGGRPAWAGVLLAAGALWAGTSPAQSVTFTYTGAVQSYTVPTQATAVYLQAAGAGGGGGGADQNGPGAAGGAGAQVTGIYATAGGTALNVFVGGGGGAGHTSSGSHSCSNAAGAAGGAGGSGGFGGGAGGEPGCSGWSGGGAGGGGASVVSTASNVPLLVAGGGGGGQGGSWNSSSIASQSSTLVGSLPASAGAAGASPGTADGGGGGGGGGGCPGGVGGSVHGDQTGTAFGTAAGAGASCAAAAVTAFSQTPAAGGTGGSGDPATDTSYPGGVAGAAGRVTISALYPLAGSVYADANHNAALDAAEAGIAVSGLYVKLSVLNAGTCQSPAIAAAAVASGSGAYAFGAVLPGSYCLTLTNSAALTNTTPYLPAGYVGTEAAGSVRQLVVTYSPSSAQNFGFYAGSTLSLVVFEDTGTGGGTANDGVRSAGEAGLAGVTVSATAAGATLASAVTSANGSVQLWLPAAAQGAPVAVQPASSPAWLATGGSAGTTGGSYARPAVSFVLAAGAAYAGVAFGLVPVSTFVAGGAQPVRPGGVIYYPHTYVAGSAGVVAFASSASATPALSGWSEILYQDLACSGQFASTDPVLSGTLGVAAGQVVCVLVREFAPATAPANSGNRVAISAVESFAGAAAPAPLSLSVTDTTTVSASGTLLLAKQVQNLTQGGAYGTTDNARPGDVLQYQVSITNNGSDAASAVVVSDATPAFTAFVSAACPAPAALPAALSSCTIATQPAVGAGGALQWTFDGSLAPGGQTAVTFQVRISP